MAQTCVVTRSIQAALGYQRGHSHRIRNWACALEAKLHGDQTQSQMAQLWRFELKKLGDSLPLQPTKKVIDIARRELIDRLLLE